MANLFKFVNNNTRGTLLEAHIADIHFGSIDPKVQYDILKEQFLDKIFRLKLDIISINGDLFDHKFMSNSDVIMYAMDFIDRIVQYCRNTGCTLILLHGTLSHDANQLKLFYRYLNDNTVDVRIVEDARFEIVKNKKILCIPELYGRGSLFYNNLFYNSGLYDSAILHGTIAGSTYGKSIEDLDSSREPVFDINNFIYCKGPVIAGHVHVAQCIKSDMYYTGSPIRDKFGEEQPKGFFLLIHNLDTRQYLMHFEEIKSFRYDTINLDFLATEDPKVMIKYINDLKSQGIDNIRVEFTIENSNIELVKEYYRTCSNVVIKDLLKSRQLDIKKKEFESRFSQYSYVLDKNLSEYEILSRYINQNMGYKYITADEIIDLLKDV